MKNVGVLNVTKQEQSSPNDKTHAMQTGDFATAWIDHGRAPKQAGYEYVVYIQPTNKEITRLIKKDGLRGGAPGQHGPCGEGPRQTGITGYVCFENTRARASCAKRPESRSSWSAPTRTDRS